MCFLLFGLANTIFQFPINITVIEFSNEGFNDFALVFLVILPHFSFLHVLSSLDIHLQLFHRGPDYLGSCFSFIQNCYARAILYSITVVHDTVCLTIRTVIKCNAYKSVLLDLFYHFWYQLFTVHVICVFNCLPVFNTSCIIFQRLCILLC